MFEFAEMTNWLFLKPLCLMHRVEPLTTRFWQILGRYAANLAAHRQTMIFTPLNSANFVGSLRLLNQSNMD